MAGTQHQVRGCRASKKHRCPAASCLDELPDQAVLLALLAQKLPCCCQVCVMLVWHCVLLLHAAAALTKAVDLNLLMQAVSAERTGQQVCIAQSVTVQWRERKKLAGQC